MAFNHPLVPQHRRQVGDGIPEISSNSSLSVLSSTDDDDWVVGLNSLQLSHMIDDGFDTPSVDSPPPLELPQHNGSGSFTDDRISEWRLDQSQLVLRELRRFEQEDHYLHSRRPRRFEDRVGTPNSAIASWDVPVPADDFTPKDNNNKLWDLFTKRVTKFIGINDHVAEIIAGERYIDPTPKEPPLLSHFQQSLDTNPHWEASFVSRMFCELHIPQPFWRYVYLFFQSKQSVSS